MRGTGEAVMNKPAIIAARKLPRIGYIALICGASLGSVAATAPAKGADLYYPQYPYPQQTAYPSYYRNCYPCGCRPCCNPCCNPCGYTYRPYIRPAPIVERHWDYWERRYPYPYPHRYPYYPNGYAGGYPNYPDGYAGGYPSYPGGYAGGARPHLGFGGVQYQYPPAAPISYEYEAPPRAPYEYEASARPGYDYDASPRPPVGIPGGYYNAGYVE
jgi:hypothetical protein